jgi:hypothetical protein
MSAIRDSISLEVQKFPPTFGSPADLRNQMEVL